MAPPRDAKKCAARGGMTRAEVIVAVFERDNYRCTECGITDEAHQEQTGRSLDVHRIAPGSMYRVDGCVLICRDCHHRKPKRERGVPDQEGSGGFFVRVDAQRHALLKKLSRETDRPIAALVRRAVNHELRENGIEPPQTPEGA